MERQGIEFVGKDDSFQKANNAFLTGLKASEKGAEGLSKSFGSLQKSASQSANGMASAEQATEGTAKGLEETGKAAESGAKGLSVFTVMLGNLAAQAIGAFINKIKGLKEGFDEMVESSAAIPGIQSAFESLGGSIEAMRAGSLGMVLDVDLMKSFNQAAQLVSVDFAQKLPDAMGYLSKVSAATGESMDFMIDSLIKGVGRLQPQILDNLNVTVTLAEATARAAEMFGVEAAATTKAQQQAGMMDVVLQKLAVNTASMADQTQSAATKIAAFGVTVQNLKDTVGQSFLGITANIKGTMANALATFAPAITTIANGLGEIANQAFETLKGLVSKVMATLGIDMGEIAANADGWGSNIVVQLANGIVSAISYVVNALSQVGQVITSMLQPGSPPKLLPNLDQWGTDAAEVYMDGWGEADMDAFDTMRTKIGSFLDTLPGIAKEKLIPLKGAVNAALASTISGAGGIAGGGVDMFDSLLDSIKGLPDQFTDYAHSLMEAQLAQNALTAATERYDAQARLVEAAQDAVTRATKATASAQQELNRVSEEYDAILNPLNKELQELQDQKQVINDEKRLAELRKTIADRSTKASDKQLAQLEMQEIAKRREIKAIEDEKDAAIDTEQVKVDAAQEVQDAEQAKLDTAQEALDLVKAEVETAKEAVTTAKKQLKLQERLLGVTQDASSMIKQQKDLLEQLATAAAAAAKAAAGIKAPALDKDGILPKSLIPADLADGLQTQITEIFGKLDNPLEGLAQSWAGEGSLLATLFPKKIDTSGMDPTQAAAMEAMQPDPAPFSERLKAVWTTAMDLLKPAIETKLTEIGEKAGDALMVGLFSALQRMMEDGTISLELWANGIVTQIEEGAVLWLAAVGQWFTDQKEAFTIWFDEQKLAFTTWFGEVKTSIIEKLAEWRLAADQFVTDQKAAFSLWFGEQKLAFTTWLEAVKTTFREKLTELKTAIAAKFAQIKAKIKEKWGEAQTFLEEIDLTQIGKDILEGLWGGLKSKWAEVSSWIEEKAKAIAAFFKLANKVSSPSKVFAEIGENIMSGLKLGLDKGFGPVEATINQQAGSLAPAMTNMITAQDVSRLISPVSPVPVGAVAGAGSSAFPSTLMGHFVFDFPGLGQTAEGDVTFDVKRGVAISQAMRLHATSKMV